MRFPDCRLVGLLPLAFLFAFISPALAQTGQLDGRVTDAADGLPLPGANVVLVGTPFGAATDADGRYQISAVPAGRYDVQITLVGYATAERRVTVAGGGTARLDLALEEGTLSLDQVTVKGEAFRPQNAAATAHVVSAEELRRTAADNPLRLIEEVPGVDLGAYRQGGVADVFSMRGFGEGGHGGDVAVQVDGIPLNEADGHADGYADLNVIVPLELQRIAVYKGPSSALYGNFARAGTVALGTRKGGAYRDLSVSGGAYETLDVQAAVGERIGLGSGLRSNVAFQFFTTDGYAANSRYLKGTVSGRFAYDLGPDTDVEVALRGHSGEWNGPGYIPEAQFRDDGARRLQGPNAEDDGGAKTFYAERVGVNHSFSDQLRLLTYGYAVQQDFTRFAKFGYEAGGQSERLNERTVYGGGASLNGEQAIGPVPVQFVVGAELYSEQTERRRWSTANRVRGDQTESRDFSIQSASGFVQAELAPSPYFRPTLGLRYDAFFGSYDNDDPGQQPFQSDLNGYGHLSPKLGVRSTVLPGLDLRASATNGYVLPNGPAKYDATLDVEPAKIWQYEVGATLELARARFDLVGYRLDTSEEIVQDPPGSGAFRNAGRTRRLGVEGEVLVRSLAGLDARLAVGLIQTEIRENPTAALVGQALTGIPARTLTASLDYTAPMGFGGRLHVHHIGPYELESDGSVQYDGYTVTNATLFYDLGARLAQRGRLFVQVDNVLDERYAEAVFAAFGTLKYAPAPPRRITLGLSIGL